MLRSAVVSAVSGFLSWTAVNLSACLAAQRSVNICAVVQNSERYRDKVVTIDGDYLRGPHGSTLANEDCGFQNRYIAFGAGAAADAEYYDSSGALPNGVRKFVDQASLREFDQKVAKSVIASKPREPDIHVTVVGLVKVATSYSIKDYGGGTYIGTGYGFQGRYPVQVVILKVTKVTVSNTFDRKP